MYKQKGADTGYLVFNLQQLKPKIIIYWKMSQIPAKQKTILR
jgi:hypothetical protein